MLRAYGVQNPSRYSRRRAFRFGRQSVGEFHRVGGLLTQRGLFGRQLLALAPPLPGLRPRQPPAASAMSEHTLSIWRLSGQRRQRTPRLATLMRLSGSGSCMRRPTIRARGTDACNNGQRREFVPHRE